MRLDLARSKGALIKSRMRDRSAFGICARCILLTSSWREIDSTTVCRIYRPDGTRE
jgi:hypothetical protein